MEENKTAEEEQSTVNEWWQRKIFKKVNAYEFVPESGTRLILPRFEGETYDIRHFPNCRYLQG